MTKFTRRRRAAFAALCAVAAITSAAPAQASTEATPGDCDVRLERLIDQFYEMADRRSYEESSDWWQARWHAYFESCVMH